MTQPSKTQSLTDDGYLSGQLLIAMPAMADDRFARSVVFLCAHTPDGAMGLIVNKPATHIKFPDLLDQLDILGDDDDVADDDETRISEMVDDLAIHIGGPVETGRGFVLHSSDYYGEDSTMQIDDIVSLTATIDILRAIASGEGPDRALLALGYAGWAPGQLDSEIRANGWLHCAPDTELLFGVNWAEKYDLALSKVGVDPSRLVSEAGHA